MAAFDVRDLAPEDVEPLGDVIYEAFRDVATKHGFRPTFDSPATARLLLNTFRATELATIVTAADGAEPIGSASMNVRSETAGIGPVAVSPRAQAGGVGRAMMEELLRRADAEGCTSVRLVQAGYNVTSFSLYSKLGFVVRDVVLSLEGRIEAPETDASAVREMRPEETATAAALDTRLTGFRREPDFALLRGIGPGWVWEQDGIVRGYLLSLDANGSVHLGPAGAEDDSILFAMLARAGHDLGDRALSARPVASQPAVLGWLLAHGMRVEEIGTYMVRGAWALPRGANLMALGFPEGM